MIRGVIEKRNKNGEIKGRQACLDLMTNHFQMAVIDARMLGNHLSWFPRTLEP
jgi:hypothetical protein